MTLIPYLVNYTEDWWSKSLLFNQIDIIDKNIAVYTRIVKDTEYMQKLPVQWYTALTNHPLYLWCHQFFPLVVSQ